MHSSKLDLSEKLDAVVCKRSQGTNSYDPSTKTWTVYTSETWTRNRPTKSLVSKILGLERAVLKSPTGVHIVIPSPHDEPRQVFAGQGSKLYRQHAKRISEGKTMTMWGGGQQTRLTTRGLGKWKLTCDKQVFKFDEVGLTERDGILANSTFEDPIWKRTVKVLARDSRGIYYYVDKVRKEFGDFGYRVFKGPRGRLKLTTMVDIIDDPKGQIFATTSGSLRLIVGNAAPPAARWVIGKKSEQLEIIDTYGEKSKLVYEGLGIYDGQEFGTICSMVRANAIAP